MSFWKKKAKDVSDETLVRVFNRERFSEEVSMAIHRIMEADDIQRSDLAEQLGCSRSHVTKLLDDNHNFRVHTLADVFFAMGYALHVYITRNPEQMLSPIIRTTDIASGEQETSETTDRTINEQQEEIWGTPWQPSSNERGLFIAAAPGGGC